MRSETDSGLEDASVIDKLKQILIPELQRRESTVYDLLKKPVLPNIFLGNYPKEGVGTTKIP